jgi:hypothetical protein
MIRPGLYFDFLWTSKWLEFWVISKVEFQHKIEKNRIPKESPTRQSWKCCRLGLIEPVDGQYLKMQVTVHTPSTGLSRIQHFTRKWWNFESRNIRTCVYATNIMEPSMWHSSAIPWNVAYGQVKECVCLKRENDGQN